MCYGFGCIVDKAGGLYFTAPSISGNVSHSDILAALGRKDNDNQFVRAFVRVECKDWTIGSFCFDETDSLPGWVDEQAVKDRVEATLDRVYPAWTEYRVAESAAWEKHETTRNAAWAEYNQARDTAQEKYNKEVSLAWKELCEARNVSPEEYNKTLVAVGEKYHQEVDPAKEKRDKSLVAARIEHDKACGAVYETFLTALSGIPGYVEGKAG